MTTTAYLRISTDQQDHASQLQQVDSWASDQQRHPMVYVTDSASGGQPWQERKLSAILEAARPGDTIVVSEISRIARSTVGVLTFLQQAAVKNVTVVAVRNKLALDDSMHSKITVTVLALAAEIERDLLRERTKAALAARRQKGLALGRPVGTKMARLLAPRADDIAAMLTARVSKRAIARVLGCSPSTLYAYLRDDPGATADTKTAQMFEE